MPYGKFCFSKKIPDDIDPNPRTDIPNKFAQFAKGRGYTVPEIKYTQAKTARTTIEFALNSLRDPVDASFLETRFWKRVTEYTWQQLKEVLVGDVYSSAAEVVAEIDNKKSPGVPHIYQGHSTKESWLKRYDDPVVASKVFVDTHHPAIIFGASMKIEPATLEKYLKRKQRMFMVKPVQAVVLHKHYFSKQSKRLRLFREIAHGQSFFFGEVNRLAQELIGGEVQSEDDEFFDKRFVFMQTIYELRKRGIGYDTMKASDKHYVDILVDALVRPLVLLPNGDLINIESRTNPSGADATTENNCIARLLVENYVLLKYCDETQYNPYHYRGVRQGTRYLGDDRIASSKGFPVGYFQYYREHLIETGVKWKTLTETTGPVGSEFAGFTIQKSHWDASYYVPYYRKDKLWYGLFSTSDENQDITLSRLCAFAFLLYPQYELYKELKPIVIAFVQQIEVSDLRAICLSFWYDEQYLQRMWTGYEAADERGYRIVEKVLAEEGYFEDVRNDSC